MNCFDAFKNNIKFILIIYVLKRIRRVVIDLKMC